MAKFLTLNCLSREEKGGRVIDSYLTSRVLSLKDIILTDIEKLGVKLIEEWEVEVIN